MGELPSLQRQVEKLISEKNAEDIFERLLDGEPHKELRAENQVSYSQAATARRLILIK